jgi:hypothetical protein
MTARVPIAAGYTPQKQGATRVIEQPAATRDPVSERLRRAYGFDEVALVPGAVTIDPAEVDTSVELAGRRLEIPFLAAAMDAVVDPDFAVSMTRHGGMAFVNLEGLYSRYRDPSAVIERVAAAESGEAAAAVLSDAYEAPIRDDLIAALIGRIKAQGGIAAVATTPRLPPRPAPTCSWCSRRSPRPATSRPPGACCPSRTWPAASRCRSWWATP